VLLFISVTLWLVLIGSPSWRSFGTLLLIISAAELTLLWLAVRQHRAATGTPPPAG
jgi:hypothetical protein